MQIAQNYLGSAKSKTELPSATLFFRSVMGGAFIALAAFGATNVYALCFNPFMSRLVSSLLFPAGLSMVLICGGELFTSACLMGLAIGKGGLSLKNVLRCWGVILLGNAVGTAAVALLTVGSGIDDPAFIQATIRTAQLKYSFPWTTALLKGLLCNMFVCIAVWMSYGASGTPGKIAALYIPIVLFVLTGTEHNVTNLY